MNQPLKIRRRPETVRRPLHLALDIAVVLLGAFGLAVLVVKWGFDAPGSANIKLLQNVLLLGAMAGLIAERVVRWATVTNLRYYARVNWLDILPLLLGGAVLAAKGSILTAAGVYIPVAVAVRAGGLLRLAVGSGIGPARLLVVSFAACILIGTGLLCLPRASAAGAEPLSALDALFTATSATCVTGLVVRDTGSEFSRFGQTVILVMIQLGGLGLMTFGTLFIMLSGKSLGLRQTAVVGEMISEQTLGGISRTIKFIILSTLCIELAGALMLHGLWPDATDSWYRGFFHSISAFCNAGFALQGDSFTAMRNSWQVTLVVPLLVILGGLGFPVLMNIVKSLPATFRYMLRYRRRVIGRPRPFWTLQARLVLTTTAILLLIGWVGLMVLEFIAVSRGGQFDGGIVSGCWFQSVSARTAGFNSVDLTSLSTAGRLWMIALMIIGGSPASTAGGMKTVCLAVTVLVVWSVLRGRHQVEIFGRTIPFAMARRAVTLAVLFLATATVTVLALSACQPSDSDFMDVLFESVSACGTVGLTLGETARLTITGKLVVITAMFIGRVGPLTLLMSLSVPTETARYSYPSEQIIVG